MMNKEYEKWFIAKVEKSRAQARAGELMTWAEVRNNIRKNHIERQQQLYKKTA